MFVGRERELNNNMYRSSRFEFAVLYGRRRVGKITLIHEFINEKQGVYYMEVEGTRKDNLNGLSKALLMQKDLQKSLVKFQDYEFLMDYIDSIAISD